MNIGEEISRKIGLVSDIVYEKGKHDNHSDFWNGYMNSNMPIQNATHINKFSGAGWNDNTFYPAEDLKVGYGKAWFMYSRITNIKQRLVECGHILDFSEATDLSSFYEGSITIEVPEIDLTSISGGTGARRLCCNCSQLITIDRIITKDSIEYANDFTGCVALKHLLWEGSIGTSVDIGDSKDLTIKSIVSTIEHLSSVAIDQTLSLSKVAVDNMVFPFVSQQSGVTYNSLEELIDTKPNWTVSLIA